MCFRLTDVGLILLVQIDYIGYICHKTGGIFYLFVVLRLLLVCFCRYATLSVMYEMTPGMYVQIETYVSVCSHGQIHLQVVQYFKLFNSTTSLYIEAEGATKLQRCYGKEGGGGNSPWSKDSGAPVNKLCAHQSHPNCVYEFASV
jgi:hypothetical protein